MLETLSRFLRTLLTPYAIPDALDGLATTVREVLDLAGAGVSISRNGELEFVTADPSALVVVDAQQQRTRVGPGIEAFRQDTVVAIEDLRTQTDRWPEYCAVAETNGILAVAGLPMKVDDHPIGALSLYSHSPRHWNARDLQVAGLFADAASVYLVNSSAYDRQRVLAEQLQQALNSRIVIEQAKGIIAGTHGVDMDEAFRLMRAYARARHSTLRTVAEAIVNLGLRI